MRVGGETAHVRGVLAYDAEQKVSVDFKPYRTFQSIFARTKQGLYGSVWCAFLAWYDMKWAFSVRMADVAVAMGQTWLRSCDARLPCISGPPAGQGPPPHGTPHRSISLAVGTLTRTGN